MLPEFRRGDKLCGVLLYISVGHHESEERAYAAEDACLRAWLYADIKQSGEESLDVVGGDSRQWAARQECDELLYVAHVCVDGVL